MNWVADRLEFSSRIYRELALQKPTVSSLGGVFFALVQPHSGHEQEYNRWYDQDHFYAAALAGPWIFAGRRWVATRRLQEARLPDPQNLAPPLSRGSLLAMYFMTAGHVAEAREWQLTMVGESLNPDGRGRAERDPIYSGYHDFRGGVIMDPEPMSHEVALDHPYGAVAIELIDASDAASRDQLLDWLRNNLIPRSADRGQCIMLTPTELDDLSRSKGLAEADPRRVCLLWLLPGWSPDDWKARFGSHEIKIRDSGLGTLVMAAPFIALEPGTDRYIDEL